MMKQKWYLLIICLVYCVTVWAQDNKPLWSIEDLKLTKVTDGEDKVVLKDDTFNLPINAKEVKATITFRLRQNQTSEEDKPGKIWYRWNNDATSSFVPTYVEVENIDTLWSVSQEIDLPMPTAGKDIALSLGLSSDNLDSLAKEQVRVWDLPGDPSLTPQSYTTFTNEPYSFTLKNDIPGVFKPKYYVNGTDITEDKVFKGNSSKDIGDKPYVETDLDLGYSYSFGDKVWVDKTGENDAISKAATLTTYHRPVYTFSIKVNNQEPINGSEATVTHNDDVELIVNHKYGYGEGFTRNWEGKGQNFTANNNGETETEEISRVTIINKISDDVVDSQRFEFKVKVLPEIKIENTIPNESYSFIPEGDTKIAIKKIHNQADLTWDCVWLLDKNKLGESDNTFEKNEITLSADQLKESKEYELVANVSCYNKNNENKKYLDGETITYKINVVPNPKVTSYGEFDNQDNIITCHAQKFIVTIETDGGYKGDNAFEFKLEKDGGNYGQSDKTEGTKYEIKYENKGSDVVESDFSFSGVNTIPKDKSTTGVEQFRKVEGTSKTFHATVYPYPEVKFKKPMLDNYFFGSEITQSVDTVYTKMPSTWVLNWSLNQDKMSPIKKDELEFKVPGREGLSDTTYTLYVVAQNIYNEKTWRCDTLKHSFTAWHRAQFDGIKLINENGSDNSDNNIYEGRKFKLSSLQKYGYPGGWEYTWERIIREDICETLSTDSTHTITAEFSGNGVSEEQIFKLKVKNSIPGLVESTVFEDDTTQTIIVWKKTDYSPESVGEAIFTITDKENESIIDNRIREGQVLRIEVPEAQYGYNNTWNYSWNLSGENSHVIDFTVPSINGNGEAMSKESKKIELRITNIGPDGKSIWEDRKFKKEYTVYRKPRTPLSLVPKGNGTSRTLVATLAISDNQMKENDYYLCFGHREADGAVTLIGEPQLQEGPGQTRFSMQIPQELWDDKNNLCVFALWHYGDGTWITSGLRFINDVKEEWDGSDYSGQNKYSGITRSGNTTSIRDVESLSQDILSTYNVSGAVRGTLQRGLNIVRMTDGTVRKVIIK